MPSAAETQAVYDAGLRRRRAQYHAANSTVEALAYELRTHGVAALARPNCRRRLADLSTRQIRDLLARLMRERRAGYVAITDDLILRIGNLL